MADHKDRLSAIFDDLDADEFGKFQWQLRNEGAIKKAKLDKANREQTIDAMVQTYNGDVVLEVTKTILEKIQRNDLVQKLQNMSNSWTDSDSKGASATQAMTQEDKSALEKLQFRRSVFIQGISDANLNLLLDKLLEKNVINYAEMESVRGERLTTGKAREIIDTVSKKGNTPCSKMIDIVGQLDAELGERLHQPSPADQTTFGLGGMTTHNRFTGAGFTQKPTEMNRMNELETKALHVHIHNTVSASNERNGMPLPILANALAAERGITKNQVKRAAKRMENKGMLVQVKNNGTASYKVAKGKKSVKKHGAAKTPKAAKKVKKPAVKKPAANKPAVNKPAANKPAANKPVANKPAAKKPVANKPAANKPVANKPAANKPVANKPAAKKPAVTKPATKKPVANKPAAKKPPAKPKAVKPRKATSKKK